MADGQYKPVELSDVLYVPSLAKNLFSVRAVVDKDHRVILKNDQCIILNKSGNVMGSGKKDGKLFILDCNMMDNQSHQVHSAIGETEQETGDEKTVAYMQIDPGANGEDNQNAENVAIPQCSNLDAFTSDFLLHEVTANVCIRYDHRQKTYVNINNDIYK
eukprot:gene21073-23127_t